MIRGLRAPTVLVVMLGLTGCGGESQEGDRSESAPGEAARPAATPPDTVPPLPEPAGDPTDTATWSIGLTSAPSEVTAPPLPVLTALRTSTHSGWVRVTFETGGGGDPAGGRVESPSGRPGYALEYVDRPLIACGSGQQIFPVGDAWLQIRLEPAAAHTEQGQPTLGEREIAVDGPLLQRIYRTCDFEGIVTYVLALSSPNPYRVVTLADPLRIVVDVQR